MSVDERPRIVISGLGSLPPAEGVAEIEGELGKRVRPGVPVPPRARLFPLRHDLDRLVPGRVLRKVSDHTRLATIACAAALQDAGLREPPDGAVVGAEAIGVCLGTGFGSSAYHLECHEALREKGVPGASALLFSQSVFNAAPGHLGQAFSLMGANAALVGGETVGIDAVHRAATRLRVPGAAETAMLAGGGEQYADLVHASLAAAGLVGAEVGGCPGVFVEGAAALVVEREAAAKARGGRIRARVVAGASCAGAVEDLPSTALRALESARTRGLFASDRRRLDHVEVCPPAGARAPEVAAAFADRLGDAYVSLGASALGEGFSFTSAHAVVLAVRALEEQTVPATDPGYVGASAIDTSRCPRDPLAADLRLVGVVAMTSRGRATALILERSEAS